jgi:hypothetical protein
MCAVEIMMTQYVDTIADTLIHPVAPKTPTDDAVRHAIATAQAAGMAVALKPHVDSLDGVWRGEIGTKYTTREHGSTGMEWGRTRQRPRHLRRIRALPPLCAAQQWADWFSNYTAFVTHYAALAQDAGVAYFNVGTELDSTESHAAEWRAVIAAARAQFTAGPMWYGCSWSPGPYAVSWWDALDFIGVDAYFPLSATPDPNVTALVEAWQPIAANLSALSASLGGKKVVFAEIGYASFVGAAVQPWACCSGPVDLATQANLFAAFFQAVWTQPWFGGVFWWAWPASECTRGAGRGEGGWRAERSRTAPPPPPHLHTRRRRCGRPLQH